MKKIVKQDGCKPDNHSFEQVVESFWDEIDRKTNTEKWGKKYAKKIYCSKCGEVRLV